MCFSINAQSSLNDYKYIIVPVKYDFQKSEDTYKINSLTKFLFNKHGFQAFLSNENLPEDLKKNRCLALVAQLKDHSNVLITKMSFNLVDCSNNVVFSTGKNKSKVKDYKIAYHTCIRTAFNEIKEQEYTYNEQLGLEESTSSSPIIREVVSQNITRNILVNSENNNGKTSPKIVLSTVEIAISKPKETGTSIDVLYAQPIKNGFQLVDSTPKVMYTLQKTNVKDVFLLNENNGIVYKVNGIWKMEYYKNEKLVSKELHLKFF